MRKAMGFPIGNRLTAWFLTMATVSLSAWGQGTAWRDTHFPYGAKITALAHGPGPDSPSRAVLAGDDAGNIFRSADGGATWRRVLSRAGAPVAAFAEMAGVLLAGAGRAFNRTSADCWGSYDCESSYSAGGVFRSVDGGTSWTRIPETKGASAFAVKGEVVYSATTEGLLASSDSGAT